MDTIFLANFHKTNESVASIFPYFCLGLLWKAPEHIENKKFPRSQPGDVFSFSIIIQEILLEDLPYGMYNDLSVKGKELPYMCEIFTILILRNLHLLQRILKNHLI